jgi:hypothetical protein
MQRRNTFLAASAFLLTAACTFNPKVDPSILDCKDDNGCPSGYRCVGVAVERSGFCCNKPDEAACFAPSDAASASTDATPTDAPADGIFGADGSVNAIADGRATGDGVADKPADMFTPDSGADVADGGQDAGTGGTSGSGDAGVADAPDGQPDLPIGGTDSGATGGSGGSGDARMPAAPDGQFDVAIGSMGGNPGTGGMTSAGGTGTGGSATGGTSTVGGTTNGGATTATGGASATGGIPSTGGTTTGGSVASGGTPSTGGSIATGGTATGGISATGGTIATGGLSSTGGNQTTGGAVSTGGIAASDAAPSDVGSTGDAASFSYTFTGDKLDGGLPAGFTAAGGIGTWDLVIDGSNVVLEGTHTGGGTTSFAEADLPLDTSTDETIQVKVRFLSAGANNVVRICGRFNDTTTDGYCLEVSTQAGDAGWTNGTMTIDQRNGGALTTPATPVSNLNIMVGEWHTYGFKIATSPGPSVIFQGLLDGVLKVSAADAPPAYDAGAVALGVRDVTADFDDLIVTTP